MFPAFLAQYAAGCFLAIAASDIRRSGPRYLRLLAIVSTSIAVLAGALLFREAGAAGLTRGDAGMLGLAAGAAMGIVWLFVNAAQFDSIRNSQRLWPALAGAACLVAAISMALDARPPGGETGVWPAAAAAISTTLAAALLGTATAAMLLGHRYLTDTGMPIDPLRWLTRIYVGVIVARGLWVLAASWPVWADGFTPQDSPLYFWLALLVRIGVGIVAAGVFAWMVWDCVKRRATQSATALYYLSMLLVVIGEGAAQYLMRTEGLTV